MSAEVFPSTNRGGTCNIYQMRVRMPLDLHKELIQLADEAGISQSDYMVRLLADRIFDMRQNKEMKEAVASLPDYNPIRDEPCMSSGYDGVEPPPPPIALENNPIWIHRQEENRQFFESLQNNDDLMAVLRSRR